MTGPLYIICVTSFITVLALNVRTYCMSYLFIVLSYVHFNIAIFVEYGELVILAIVGALHLIL